MDAHWGGSLHVHTQISKGAASTLNSGTVKTITRGVNIENANFMGKDLSSVSFQQSLIRDGNFRDAKLVSASFFDADLTGADFTGANLNQVGGDEMDTSHGGWMSAHTWSVRRPDSSSNIINGLT